MLISPLLSYTSDESIARPKNDDMSIIPCMRVYSIQVVCGLYRLYIVQHLSGLEIVFNMCVLLYIVTSMLW